MDEREIEKFKRRQKDEIIVRKTCELTNDSLTLFNEIFFFNCSKIILRLTQGFRAVCKEHAVQFRRWSRMNFLSQNFEGETDSVNLCYHVVTWMLSLKYTYYSISMKCRQFIVGQNRSSTNWYRLRARVCVCVEKKSDRRNKLTI